MPWLAALSRQRSLGGAALQGWWLSFLLGLLSGHWVARGAREFLGLSWPLGAMLLLTFAAFLAQPFLVVAGPLIRAVDREVAADSSPSRTLLAALCAALLFTGLDALTPRLFDVGLGVALHGAPRLRQVADLGGVPLLTFLVVLANLVVWRVWVVLRSHPKPRGVLLACATALACVWIPAAVYGALRNRATEEALAEASRELRVGVVQGNVPNDVRLAWARGDDRAAEKQLSAYMLPTEELAQRSPPPEMIVWPEATFPGVFRKPGSTLQRGRANKFDRQVLRLNRPIAFGAYDVDERGEGHVLYNALFVVTPKYDRPGALGTVHTYRKSILLPFAETLPAALRQPWLRERLPSIGFFGEGSGPLRIETTTPSGTAVALGPLICSESLSAAHVLGTARLGVDLLLNIGSDGWFGAFGEPQFHLAVARLRSVESRLPQIRAANTGISAILLPGGEIAHRTELGVEATLEASVPLASLGPSLLVRWGDWFGPTALVGGLALLLALAGLRFRSSRPRAER